MASVSQMRQDSLQKSILFMQQEHANTLKGFHEEIQKLQKKCSGRLIIILQILQLHCAKWCHFTKIDLDEQLTKDAHLFQT